MNDAKKASEGEMKPQAVTVGEDGPEKVQAPKHEHRYQSFHDTGLGKSVSRCIVCLLPEK